MVTQGRLRPPNVCADFFLHRVFVADEDLLFILPMISVSSGKTKQNKKAAKIKWCKVPSIPLRWLQSKKQLWELSRTAPLASHQRRNWQRSCREALGCVPPACRAPPGQCTEVVQAWTNTCFRSAFCREACWLPHKNYFCRTDAAAVCR